MLWDQTCDASGLPQHRHAVPQACISIVMRCPTLALAESLIIKAEAQAINLQTIIFDYQILNCIDSFYFEYLCRLNSLD
jgi:hypothetical protein